MSALELNLPQYLYVETRDEDGTVTGTELAADKLLIWAGHGYGHSIADYCRKLLDREIQTIDTWQERSLLLLDEQWHEAENGEDDDAAELQYALACERVIRAADSRRDQAAARMVQQQAAIEQLVHEAEVHLEETRPAEDNDASMGLLFALLAAGALVYTLLC
jgi:hypothetical protein